MTDPRELLDAYASAEAIDDDYKHPTYEDVAPGAIAALRAALELHQPNSKIIDQWTRCRHCHDQDGSDYRPWPCPTVQAITEALAAQGL